MWRGSGSLPAIDLAKRNGQICAFLLQWRAAFRSRLKLLRWDFLTSRDGKLPPQRAAMLGSDSALYPIIFAFHNQIKICGLNFRFINF